MRLFWLTFVSLGFLAGGLSAQRIKPIFYKCFEHMDSLVTPCPTYMDNFANCPEKEIYASDHLHDQMFVKNINMKNLNKAFKYLCSKIDIHNEINIPCMLNIKTCFNDYLKNPQPSCANDMISCIYKSIRPCSLKAAMVFSEVLKMVKSTACTLSNYQYKLKPFYGPEMHCYPKLLNSSKLGPNYQQFCVKFIKEEVSQCIEDTLQAKESSFILDDDYIKEAKEFFRQRSEMCQYISHFKPKTCPSVDVVSCQEDLFTKDALQKPFDVLLRSYAACVYEKYYKCDETLATIIKYNLSHLFR